MKLDNKKMTENKEKKYLRFLPDSVTDIVILLGLVAVVICIVLGLRGKDDE